MRPLLLALCAAFAVILTGGLAHAQSGRPAQVRCYGVLASHRLADSDQVTSPVKSGKQLTAPTLPSRSQAPTLCSDPTQPGCQVDRPDAPRHHGGWGMHHEPVELTSHTLEIPPQAVDSFDPAAQFHGGPRAGRARSPWRPPSA